LLAGRQALCAYIRQRLARRHVAVDAAVWRAVRLLLLRDLELTSLSLLKHWTWPVVIMDVAWGSFVTAATSTAGLLIANWLTPKV